MQSWNHLALHRRAVLKGACGAGAAWLTQVADLLAESPKHHATDEPVESLIVLWLAGGPSQLETFDPHPGTDIAAGTNAIATAAPGIQLAAGLERLADQMHHVALVRSLVSKEGDHERGTYYVKTGYRPEPTVIHPSIGAVVCHELPAGTTDIPRHVSILPGAWPGHGGYLGEQYNAFNTFDPRQKVPDVKSLTSSQREQQRLSDLQVVEDAFRQGRATRVAATRHRETVSDARRMMTSEQLQAFDVSKEPLAIQMIYGDTPFGRGCLAARRLVQVGVRCVEVTLSGWDSHVNNHEIHAGLVATLDPAFAALIKDLEEHQLLGKTIVLCGGEFGRTPRLNRAGGRDHWPHGFSFAVAGGGLRSGLAVGETDPAGGRSVSEPYSVADLHATVLKALGIDPEHELLTSIGRPLKLSDGTPIRKLLG